MQILSADLYDSLIVTVYIIYYETSLNQNLCSSEIFEYLTSIFNHKLQVDKTVKNV